MSANRFMGGRRSWRGGPPQFQRYSVNRLSPKIGIALRKMQPGHPYSRAVGLALFLAILNAMFDNPHSAGIIKRCVTAGCGWSHSFFVWTITIIIDLEFQLCTQS